MLSGRLLVYDALKMSFKVMCAASLETIVVGVCFRDLLYLIRLLLWWI